MDIKDVGIVAFILFLIVFLCVCHALILPNDPSLGSPVDRNLPIVYDIVTGKPSTGPSTVEDLVNAGAVITKSHTSVQGPLSASHPMHGEDTFVYLPTHLATEEVTLVHWGFTLKVVTPAYTFELPQGVNRLVLYSERYLPEKIWIPDTLTSGTTGDINIFLGIA